MSNLIACDAAYAAKIDAAKAYLEISGSGDSWNFKLVAPANTFGFSFSGSDEFDDHLPNGTILRVSKK